MGVSENILVDHSEVLVSVFFITGLMCERTVRCASVPAASQRKRRRRAGKAKEYNGQRSRRKANPVLASWITVLAFATAGLSQSGSPGSC